MSNGSRKGLIIVLSGFSGAGKGTIMKKLLVEYPGEVNLSISATTRKKRIGEEDGREYFFKTREEFDSMVKNGEFLEYATFNDNSYGTPRAYVEQLMDEGKDVILEIEVQGALQVKKQYPEAILMFVMAPDAKSLKDRLIGRGTEDEANVTNRLSISAKESQLMDQYDYLIVNDSVDTAVKQVRNIIRSEHHAVKRNAARIKAIQEDVKQFLKGE